MMRVSPEDLAHFNDQGLLFQKNVLSEEDLKLISTSVDGLLPLDMEGRVLEDDGLTPRALHGCHLGNELFEALPRLPVLLATVKEILQAEVYLYQFKINIKASFRGDIWPWHQDYIFWKREDGMPEPRAVSVLIFLDEVTEFNGPIYFMPGSHREGCIDPLPSEIENTIDWQRNVSADLKYRLDENLLKTLALRYGMVSPKGQPGAALFFHCNIVHGSSSNISPFSRRVIIITYNAIDNVQCFSKSVRPEFLVGRDFRPLKSLEDHQIPIGQYIRRH